MEQAHPTKVHLLAILNHFARLCDAIFNELSNPLVLGSGHPLSGELPARASSRKAGVVKSKAAVRKAPTARREPTNAVKQDRAKRAARKKAATSTMPFKLTRAVAISLALIVDQPHIARTSGRVASNEQLTLANAIHAAWPKLKVKNRRLVGQALELPRATRQAIYQRLAGPL